LAYDLHPQNKAFLLATYFIDLFDYIEDSIYREGVWILQVYYTFTLTTINLIYYLVTLISWVIITVVYLVIVTFVLINLNKKL